MKKFLLYIFGLVALFIALIFILEFTYNSVYKWGAYRNKVMWMHNLKNESLDYVIFGSSRANNTIIPKLIFNKTGKKGLNLGIQASGPLEIELAVREYLKFNTAKRLFIQVDSWYNRESPVKNGQLSWIPYIVNDDIYEVFKPYGNEYFMYKNIPFYRYLIFDSHLGYRNVLLSVTNKDINFVKSLGYTEVNGKLKKDNPFKFNIKDRSNSHFTAINQLCENHNVEVIYFTAPIYRPEGNFDVLKRWLPNYYDFSMELQNINFYMDQEHLNKKGAYLFTEIFIDAFFIDY